MDPHETREQSSIRSWRGGASANAADIPERIGHYRILELIGEGAMGTVHVAVQRKPVRRRVAIKIVKPGMDSRELVARFDLERQALAVMNHANIATLFEAGTTEHGQPYFVMEFVEGTPITTYCDRHGLSIHHRILLFLQVCSGVHHAHQHGVIHRDLKPDNLLVTGYADSALAKIIDFGIARATDQQLVSGTLYTEHGRILGTPEYMSPEQAQPEGCGIDARSDVYSLGVVLHQLLIGETPFSRQELRGAGLLEFQRRIREVDPPKPSRRIASIDSSIADLASRRSTTANTLQRQLRCGLDWIVLKAIEKEPNRRYCSADELALDLERHLAGEPIQAGPPGVSYRLRRLARRKRSVMGAALGMLLAFALGLILQVLFAASALSTG